MSLEKLLLKGNMCLKMQPWRQKCLRVSFEWSGLGNSVRRLSVIIRW
jgi:hypothetical protein